MIGNKNLTIKAQSQNFGRLDHGIHYCLVATLPPLF